MKRTRKNMLRSSAAMLLVSALALTSATYAWFTNGNSGNVENFSLTARTASGLQLSADAENWKSTITKSDITTAQSATAIWPTETFDALSSSGVASGGKLTMFGIETDDSGSSTVAYTTTVDVDSTSQTNLIKFDLYVKNETATAQDFVLNLADSKVNGVSDSGIQNAVRVAFLSQGSVAISDANSVTTVKGKSGASGTALLWEPNGESHISGKWYTYSGHTDTYAITAAIEKSWGNTISDTGVLESITGSETSISTGSGTATVFQKQSTEYGTSGEKVIASIAANTLNKFTIYIWLEGQDVDCTNQEAGGSIDIALNFVGSSNSSTTATGGN